MEKNDYKKFMEIMTTLGELYSREISAVILKVYWESCKNLTIDQFSKNTTNHINTSQFFPKPCDLLGTIDIEAYIKVV